MKSFTDMRTGKHRRFPDNEEGSLMQPTGCVTSLAVICCAKRSLGLLAGTLSLLLGLSDHSAGQQRASLANRPGSVRSLSYSPDGKWLVVCAGGGNTKIWETATAKHAFTLEALGGGLQFSADGKTLVISGSMRGLAYLLDTTTWKTRLQLPRQELVSGLAISPDGKEVALANYETGKVSRYDATTGEVLPALKADLPVLWPARVAYSSDSKVLAISGKEKIILWDLATNKAKAVLEGHSVAINSLQYSPDGKLLASSDHGPVVVPTKSSQVFLWDAATGQRKSQLDVQRINFVKAVAFTADSKTLGVLTHSAGWVSLYDTTTGKYWGSTIIGSPHSMGECLAFSPDGKTVAVGCMNGSVRLCDVPARHAGDNILFEGTWQVVLTNGRVTKEQRADMRVQFAGDKLRILSKAGVVEEEYTYRVDASTTPKQIDLWHKGLKNANEKLVGIYADDGAQLHIIWSKSAQGERPTRAHRLAPPEQLYFWLTRDQ